MEYEHISELKDIMDALSDRFFEVITVKELLSMAIEIQRNNILRKQLNLSHESKLSLEMRLRSIQGEMTHMSDAAYKSLVLAEKIFGSDEEE